MLEYFTDELIEATIMIKGTAPGDDNVWVDTLTEGDTISGLKYNLSISSAYRNVTWTGVVSEVFVTESSAVGKDDKLRINNIDYECEFPDDVASQGELYLVGLRRAV